MAEPKCKLCGGPVQERVESGICTRTVDCMREYNRQYYLDHVEERRVYDREYAATHREQKRASRRAWGKRNVEKLREQEKARHAANRDADLAYLRQYYVDVLKPRRARAKAARATDRRAGE